MQHLLLHYPEFVHWLQNNRDKIVDGHRKPTANLLSEITSDEEEFKNWLKTVRARCSNANATFFENPEFHRYLRKITLDPPGLSDMLDAKVF